MVPRAGLEPAPISGPDFESGVATNYTTEAPDDYASSGSGLWDSVIATAASSSHFFMWAQRMVVWITLWLIPVNTALNGTPPYSHPLPHVWRRT